MTSVKIVSSKPVQNLYPNLPKGKTGKKYSRVGGLAIDRTNKLCFIVATSSDKYAVGIFSADVRQVLKGKAAWSLLHEWIDDKKVENTAAGHPNGLCAKPSGKNTYLYIATCRDGKGVLRVLVDNAKKKVSKQKTFHLYYSSSGKQVEGVCRSVAYSTGLSKHVIRRTGNGSNHKASCYIGNFQSNGKFGTDRKIYLKIGPSVKVPGHGTMCFDHWACQGMTYYKGYIYLTMAYVPRSGYADKAKHKSVMVAYSVGNLNKIAANKTFEPSYYLFDDITFNSTESEMFEFEGVDCYADKAFVAVNESRRGQGDCIRIYSV